MSPFEEITKIISFFSKPEASNVTLPTKRRFFKSSRQPTAGASLLSSLERSASCAIIDSSVNTKRKGIDNIDIDVEDAYILSRSKVLKDNLPTQQNLNASVQLPSLSGLTCTTFSDTETVIDESKEADNTHQNT